MPGEDPYLSGEYATQFVQGFEHAPEDPNGFLQASACCKHYVANEMESTTQLDGESWDRQHYDAAVTQRDLVDSRVGRAGSHDASRRHAVATRRGGTPWAMRRGGTPWAMRRGGAAATTSYRAARPPRRPRRYMVPFQACVEKGRVSGLMCS